jgi:hypothetical protein
MIDRRRLPNRHACESISFECAGMACMATVARFLRRHSRRDFSVQRQGWQRRRCRGARQRRSCSLALQNGVPIETIRRALLRDPRGEPSSPLGKALDLLAEQSS